MTDDKQTATDRIRVGADVGGTFTDVVVLSEEQELVTAKVPTTDDQSEGVLEGIRKACEKADVDPEEIDAFSHAMTVSTNALLEESGARTALVTTEGFRDVLEIGRQDRPALYDLAAEKSDPLVPRRRRFEVAERATPDGVERVPDEEEVRSLADEIRRTDAESAAVSLLHAYADPENERTVARILREELDAPVSASHEVLAAFREYERTATTVVDAYVTPTIDAYLGRLVERVEAAGLPAPMVMQSNGGIADAETVREHAVTTCLSGPAAGVVGADATVRRAAAGEDGADATARRAAAGEDGADATAESADPAGLVTFDMGGTSSDVSLVRDGEVERTTEAEIGGRPVGVPMVDVTTVGAGGGSVARVDAGGALRVGPESAGADPGPACYGKGGTEPTVTDANAVLGYLGGDTALGGELSLDLDAARGALADLADEADLSGPVEAARGVYRVANASMTRAVRAVTVERGHDPRNFALAAFGGAGPMHAAALADRLDVGRVAVPRACGVLSAFGLLAADETRDAVRTYRTTLAEADANAIERVLADLADEARADLRDPESATVSRQADLRYAGQSFELSVEIGDSFDSETVAQRFHETHETASGYRMDETVELVGLRAQATVARETPAVTYEGAGDARVGEREANFGGKTYETPVYRREALPAGREFSGPAVCEQADSTVVVPPGWRAAVRDDGTLVLEREVGE